MITTILLTYVLINAVCAVAYIGFERGHYYEHSATVHDARRKYEAQMQAARWTLLYLAPFELIAHFVFLRVYKSKPVWMSPFKTA